MITGWKLYWITRLDSAGNMAFMFGLIAVIGAVCLPLGISEYEWPKKIMFVPLAFLVLSFVLGFFVPTAKEMAAILIVPKLSQAISENKELRELPNNLVGLANAWIQELTPKKESDQ